MKLTIDSLSLKEKQQLVIFYDSETYKVFKKLLELERDALARDHVGQTDILQIRYLSGQSTGLKNINLALKQLHKDANKS